MAMVILFASVERDSVYTVCGTRVTSINWTRFCHLAVDKKVPGEDSILSWSTLFSGDLDSFCPMKIETPA